MGVELMIVTGVVSLGAVVLLWVTETQKGRARDTVADLLDVQIPQELTAVPTGERMQEARARLAQRRENRQGRTGRRNDLEARLRAVGVDRAAVEIPEPMNFDVPEDVDDDGVLMPIGRGFQD